MKFSSAALLGLSVLANACILPEESGALGALEIEQVLIKRQANNNTGLAIGTGDRFQGGKKFPRGLGTQARGTDLGPILSVKEIESAFKGLAKEYGFETFTTPYKTYEKASIFGGKIGGKKCRDSHAVFLNAAIQYVVCEIERVKKILTINYVVLVSVVPPII